MAEDHARWTPHHVWRAPDGVLMAPNCTEDFTNWGSYIKDFPKFSKKKEFHSNEIVDMPNWSRVVRNGQ